MHHHHHAAAVIFMQSLHNCIKNQITSGIKSYPALLCHSSRKLGGRSRDQVRRDRQIFLPLSFSFAGHISLSFPWVLAMDLSIYHPSSLFYTQEKLSMYRPGGYHPVCLGDTFKDGRYKIFHKLGWGGFSMIPFGLQETESAPTEQSFL
jgi:hypothetical protein